MHTHTCALRLWLLAALTCHALASSFIPQQLGLFTAIPYTQTVKLNGITTDLAGAQVRCSNNVPSGTIQIGTSFETDITCIAPQVRYSFDEIGRIPSSTVLHITKFTLTGDTEQFNASIAEQIQELQATARKLLFSFSDIGDALSDAGEKVGSAASNVPGLSFIGGALRGLSGGASDKDLQSLRSDFNNFQKGPFKMLNTTVYETLTTLTQMADNITDIFTAQGVVFDGIRGELNSLVAQQNASRQNTLDMSLAISLLGQNTDARIDQIVSTYNQNQILLMTRLTGESQAVTTEISRIYDMLGLAQNVTKEQFAQVLYREQTNSDIFNRFLAVYWRAVNYVQVRRVLTSRYWLESDALAGTEIPLVFNDGLRPLDEFIPSDNRILVEKTLVNYVGVQTGLPAIKQVTINLYADALTAVQDSVPFLAMDSLMRTIGPASCARSFIALDVFNNPIPEDAAHINGSRCAMWAEITTTTCLAANATFNWRTADPTQTPSNQDGVLYSRYCANTATTTAAVVIRSINDMKDFFGRTLCPAQIYSGSRQEFQLRYALLRRNGYYDAAQQAVLCPQNLQDQGGTGNSMLMQYFQMVTLATYMFPASVSIAELKIFGRLPTFGWKLDENNIKSTAIRRDADGNLIADGGAEAKEYKLYWTSASQTTVPVYKLTAKTNPPIIKGMTIESFSRQANFTPDYDVQRITTNVDFSTDLSHILPDQMIWVKDPTLPGDIPDVPQILLPDAPDPRALRGSLLFYLMPPGTVDTLSLEEYVALNGLEYAPSDGLNSVSSYYVTRALDEDGYPYCSIASAVPAGYNATDTRPISYGVSTNSKQCLVMKAFQVSKALSAGQFEIHLAPRIWTQIANVQVTSGKQTIVVDSSCPDFSLSPANATFVRLTLQNQLSIQNTVVIATSTTDTAQPSQCTTTRTVVMTPAPTTKVIELPACSQLSVTVSRIAIDPDNVSPPSTIQCGQTISTTAVDEAVRSYTGIPLDVRVSIVNATSEVSSSLAGTAATAFLTNTAIAAIILSVIGGQQALIDAIVQARASVLSGNTSEVIAFNQIPVGGTVRNGLEEILAAVVNRTLNLQLITAEQSATLNSNVDKVQQLINAFAANDFGGTFEEIGRNMSQIITILSQRVGGGSGSCGIFSLFCDLNDLVENLGEGLGKAGLAVIGAAVDVVKDVAGFAKDSLLEATGLFGKIFGAFGSTIAWALAIFIAIVVMVPFALIFRWYVRREIANVQKLLNITPQQQERLLKLLEQADKHPASVSVAVPGGSSTISGTDLRIGDYDSAPNGRERTDQL